MSEWRPLTWVIVVWNVLMAVWLVSTLASGADTCSDEFGSARDACEAGAAVGGGIAVAFVLFVAAMGDVILGVIWTATKKNEPQSVGSGRECPHCRETIQWGANVCRFCGRDIEPPEEKPGHCWKCGTKYPLRQISIRGALFGYPPETCPRCGSFRFDDESEEEEA